MATTMLAAINHAASKGKVDQVRKLLQANPLLATTRDSRGWTPPLLAAYYDQPEIVRVFLEMGAPINDVDTDGFRASALHWLAGHGRAAVAVALVTQHGADPNLRDAEGQTPLHRACRNDHALAVLALLMVGADPAVETTDGEFPDQLTDSALARCFLRMFERGCWNSSSTSTSSPPSSPSSSSRRSRRQRRGRGQGRGRGRGAIEAMAAATVMEKAAAWSTMLRQGGYQTPAGGVGEGEGDASPSTRSTGSSSSLSLALSAPEWGEGEEEGKDEGRAGLFLVGGKEEEGHTVLVMEEGDETTSLLLAGGGKGKGKKGLWGSKKSGGGGGGGGGSSTRKGVYRIVV